MTTTVIEKLSDVQTQVLDAMANVKEPVSHRVSTVVDLIVDRVPNIPVVPFATYIPTPKEVIDNQYKFVKSLIDTNKDIALSVAKAAAPLTDKVLDRTSPVRKAAASAKKSA